jgi:RNA polymerase sigma-70 factor, ECF subfamily
MIGEALSSLSEPHRAVLAETYFRGRTVDQAADVLGVSPATVKQRAYHALRALRAALDERGALPATGAAHHQTVLHRPGAELISDQALS